VTGFALALGGALALARYEAGEFAVPPPLAPHPHEHPDPHEHPHEHRPA
jgi:hypothetical protein